MTEVDEEFVAEEQEDGTMIERKDSLWMLDQTMTTVQTTEFDEEEE